MKSTTTITLDTELMIDIRKQNINISGLCNSFLRECFSVKEGNTINKENAALDGLKSRIIELEKELIESRKRRERGKREIVLRG